MPKFKYSVMLKHTISIFLILFIHSISSSQIMQRAERHDFEVQFITGLSFHFSHPIYTEYNLLKFANITFYHQELSAGYFIDFENVLGITVGNNRFTSDPSTVITASYDSTYVYTKAYFLEEKYWLGIYYAYNLKPYILGAKIGLLYPSHEESQLVFHSLFLGRHISINKNFSLNIFLCYASVSKKLKLNTIRGNQLELLIGFCFQI